MKLGVGLGGGVVAHYANGAVLGIIYAGVGPSLWGPGWARALTFMTIQTIFGVWLFMLPLLDAGVAGRKMGTMVPVITMARLSLLKSRPARLICSRRTDPLFGRLWSDGSESSLGH